MAATECREVRVDLYGGINMEYTRQELEKGVTILDKSFKDSEYKPKKTGDKKKTDNSTVGKN